MTDDAADLAAENLRLTFDLCAAGEAIKWQQLRREHSGASDEEIEALLVAWLHERPGAPFGDAEGRPVQWPRPPPLSRVQSALGRVCADLKRL